MNDSAANVDLRPVRIAQVSRAQRRLPHERQAHDLAAIRRFGIAYMSDGVAALPAAGLSRRFPISCAISTVSGSL